MESLYQEFIYKSRYSRYLPEKNRRENWEETINRYLDFMEAHLKDKYSYDMTTIRPRLFDHIHGMKVMPSMRALMTSGKALERDNTCGYNCSFLPIDDPKAFDEAMFILLCGTGVGFSVERQFINQLPEIPEKIFDSETVISVRDSKEGWAKALRMLISLLYAGEVPKWDSETKKWVSNSSEDSTLMSPPSSPSKSTNTTVEVDPQDDMDADDDLPF